MFKKEEKPIAGERLTKDEGVIKETLMEGKGEYPKTGQEIAVVYKGVWTNGDEMESNMSVQAPYKFIVGIGQVMQGWDIVIPTMKKGERAKVTIEPKYASGWPTCPTYFPFDAKAQYEIDLLDFYDKRKPLSTYKTEELQKYAEEYKSQGKEWFLANRNNYAMYCYYESLRFIESIDKMLPPHLELQKAVKLNLAVCYFKDSNWNETIKMCNSLLSDYPQLVKALYLRGSSYAKQEKNEQAIKDLEQVVQAAPEDTKAKNEYERLLKIKSKLVPKKTHKTVYSELFDTHKLYEEKPIIQKALPKYNPHNPRVYIDIQIGKEEPQRVIFELFADILPKTCENFKCLCTGEKKSLNPKLHYAGCLVLAISKGFGMFTGDLENKVGIEEKKSATHCIYGSTFLDEGFSVAHAKEGILSMYNSGKDTNASQFIITFRACPDLDGRQVAFGRVIKGIFAIKKIENTPTNPEGKPNDQIYIVDCGAYPDPIISPENC